MPAKPVPDGVDVRCYQVGFGDCFLLTFKYPNFNRNVLIDFGTMKLPRNVPRDHMTRVAKHIQEVCGGKLDVVVATHRHKDHISGFATNKSGTAPGDIIASCEPSLVVQPWTENPQAARDATSASRSAVRGFVNALQNMEAVAGAAVQTAKALNRGADGKVLRQLAFLGEDNISNRSAVENLMTMGKNRYVKHGDSLPLARILPGVKVHVLGPPSLKQSDEIRKMRREDAEQFWHLQALTVGTFATEGEKPLFPKHASKGAPISARWFRIRMRKLRAEMMLPIVRILDRQMNNTSLILLFEFRDKLLLFPGDAQIENWLYALSKADIRKLLRSVDLYKAGHHGSLNATPKEMWNLFEKRKEEQRPARLHSLLSTLAGLHGHGDSGTEVPRKKLVAELKRRSLLTTTESFGEDELCRIVPL